MALLTDKEKFYVPAGMHPVQQSSKIWGSPPLYDWQIQILRDVWIPGSLVAVKTPNKAGKTEEIVANIGLSFMAAFRGAQVVSTAGAWRQIEEQLWPVLRAKLNKTDFPGWKVIEGKVTAPSVEGMTPSTWNAFSADDPAKAEGYHSRTQNGVYQPLLCIIDEAKNVKQGIFEAFYRCDPDMLLVTSTPGEDSGPFYDLITKRMEGWDIHDINWEDCPHLRTGREQKRRMQLIVQYGENHPLIQSMIFGNFFRAGGDYIFSMKHVDAAMSNTLEPLRGQRRAAVDLSSGADEQVFGVRDGNQLKSMVVYREKDADKLCTDLITLFRKWELTPENITIDEGGIGDPIIDFLEARGWVGINRFNFNAAPDDKQKYKNKGSEAHYQVNFMLMRGELCLLQDETLREQLRVRKYLLDEGSKIWTEPKKAIRARGENSPDRLDMLVMLFHDMPLPTKASLTAQNATPTSNWAQQEEFDNDDELHLGIVADYE